MADFVANTLLPLAAELDRGELQLQQCGQCQQVSYPPRELCGHCLADALSWQPQAGSGQLLATTRLHYSLEPALQPQLPIAIGSVKLSVGPVVIAYLDHPGCQIGDHVVVTIQRDPSGNAVLVASAANCGETL